MSRTATAVEHEGPATGRGGGSHERVTVNLTRKASNALANAVQLTGDSKTDTINKALQVYQLLQQIQADGGADYLKESAGAELERLRVL